MAKRTTAKSNTLVTLSTGIDVWFNPVPTRMAQDLILYLTKSQLVTADGTVIDTDNIDSVDTTIQLDLIEGIMGILDTILLEPGIVNVTLPEDTTWLRRILRRSYVKSELDPEDIANAKDDEELQRFLYIRYVAIGDDDDFNVILNNTLLRADTGVVQAE